MWVIQYNLSPPCWLSRNEATAYGGSDVTWNLRQARRFMNREDASHEILKLGLPGVWVAVDVGEVHAQKGDAK
jgi:hypothetical protein